MVHKLTQALLGQADTLVICSANGVHYFMVDYVVMVHVLSLWTVLLWCTVMMDCAVMVHM